MPWLDRKVEKKYNKFKDKLERVSGLACMFFSVEVRDIRGGNRTEIGQTYGLIMRLTIRGRIQALKKELSDKWKLENREVPYDEAAMWLDVLSDNDVIDRVVDQVLTQVEKNPQKKRFGTVWQASEETSHG